MKGEPEDNDFGLFKYSWDGPGIGGKIKSKPNDFVVIEIDHKTNQPLSEPPQPLDFRTEEVGGLYLTGRAVKTGLDHSRMIKFIAQAFKVSINDVKTAGVKDSRAKTIQLFSVFNPRKRVSDPYFVRNNLQIDNFIKTKQPVFAGSMGGNSFRIKIEGSERVDTDILEGFSKKIKRGITNFYGYQRFGSIRPITHIFGRHILNKRFKDAVDVYLGGRSYNASEDYFRNLWRETKDPHTLLAEWEKIPYLEKIIVQSLIKKPNDFKGAIGKLPEFILRLSIASFVSFCANNYLSKRNLSSEPLQGERIIESNIEIALPSKKWPKPLNSIWEEIFENLEISLQEFKAVNHMSRFLFLRVKNFSIHQTENSTGVRFDLPTGGYATTVLRDLMKSDPISYF